MYANVPGENLRKYKINFWQNGSLKSRTFWLRDAGTAHYFIKQIREANPDSIEITEKFQEDELSQQVKDWKIKNKNEWNYLVDKTVEDMNESKRQDAIKENQKKKERQGNKDWF